MMLYPADFALSYLSGYTAQINLQAICQLASCLLLLSTYIQNYSQIKEIY